MNADTAAEAVSAAPNEAEALAHVRTFMDSHQQRHGTCAAPAFFLAGTDEHDRVELTVQLNAILKQVVQALSSGQSISILTRDREISTQRAAEILGLSRPTVVRLIDAGALRAHVPGVVRRKLLLAEVLAYREGLRERRNRFITENSAGYDEGDSGDAAALLTQARPQR